MVYFFRGDCFGWIFLIYLGGPVGIGGFSFFGVLFYFSNFLLPNVFGLNPAYCLFV